MIFKGSRYENVPVVQVTSQDGRTVSALGIRFLPPTPAGYRHTFTADQRLDILAYNFYQAADKFWRIADANDAIDPVDLEEPGRQVLIPPAPL